MTISIEDNEDKIRSYFRDRRDRLKQSSAKLSLTSRAIQREDLKTIFHMQGNIYEWFAELYETIEKLFLTIHELKVNFQQYEPIIKHFKDYLTKVEQERERFR